MIHDPSAKNNVYFHSMIAIGQFSQHWITVSDVVEFDEILGEVNWSKINKLVSYEPCKISTISLDQILFTFCLIMQLKGLPSV